MRKSQSHALSCRRCYRRRRHRRRRAKPYYEEKLKESKGIAERAELGKSATAAAVYLPSFHSNWERVKIKEQEEKEQRATWYFASSTFQHGVAQPSLHSLVPSLESALLLPILSVTLSSKSLLVAQK